MQLQKITFLIVLCIMVGSLSLLIASCRKSPEAKADPNTTIEESSTVTLGSLHGRKVIVRLESGSEFSILDPEGNPIALSLSKSDFQARYPKLFEEIEAAVAEGDTTDASMY